jgi:hypothetical protein
MKLLNVMQQPLTYVGQNIPHITTIDRHVKSAWIAFTSRALSTFP